MAHWQNGFGLLHLTMRPSPSQKAGPD